ncbi:hypothetical protein Bca101_000869 [Brassica carinata]
MITLSPSFTFSSSELQIYYKLTPLLLSLSLSLSTLLSRKPSCHWIPKDEPCCIIHLEIAGLIVLRSDALYSFVVSPMIFLRISKSSI